MISQMLISSPREVRVYKNYNLLLLFNHNLIIKMEIFIKLFNTISTAIQKHGLMTVVYIFTLVFMSYMVIDQYNNQRQLLNMLEKQPQAIVEHQAEVHVDKVRYRMAITPEIENYIEEVQREIDVDRVFIAEYHNGQENLCGLPFSRFSITYESDRKLENGFNLKPLKGPTFSNINLSLFSFPTTMVNNISIFYDIDEIEKLDPVFHAMLMGVDKNIKYMYLSQIDNENVPLGFIGITSQKRLTNLQVAKIMQVSHMLSNKLTYNKIDADNRQQDRNLKNKK